MSEPIYLDGDDWALGMDGVPADFFEEDNSLDEYATDEGYEEPDRMWGDEDE